MDPENKNRTSEHKARIKRLRKIIIAAAIVAGLAAGAHQQPGQQAQRAYRYPW